MSDLLDFTSDELELLKRTIAKGVSDLEFKLFVQVCQQTGLNPFSRQICPVLRWDKKAECNVMSIQTQVDGFRLLAQRTGEYAGSDRPLFDEGLTIYEHKQASRGRPQTCVVTVYRMVAGQRCPFSHEVAWDEFYPGAQAGFMWGAKPYQMMAKTAESQALRKGFQGEIGALRTEEEINADSREATPRQERTGGDWAEFCEDLQTATSAERIAELEGYGLQRFPSNRYRVEREVSAARELLSMGGRIVQAATAPTIEQINRDELMAQSAEELFRLGCSNQDGRSYLLKRYGKKARSKLSDLELQEFVEYLRSLDSPGSMLVNTLSGGEFKAL